MAFQRNKKMVYKIFGAPTQMYFPISSPVDQFAPHLLPTPLLIFHDVSVEAWLRVPVGIALKDLLHVEIALRNTWQ